jgi:mannose-1-phosphate guanylyltransferase
VVFAGGIGTRFWPLSTPERPKQLLALVGDRPLIAESIGRLAPTIPPERVLVLTSADIADALHAAIPDVPAANMLIEPRPMGTAAALAWGAQTIADRVGRKATFVAMHADLAVGYPDELRRVLKRAAVLASTDGAMVAVGAQPTRPETGFGYLLPRPHATTPARSPDAAPPRDVARPVARFVEKPGHILAEELIAQGALWNTGIFVAQAGPVLDALEERTPELQPGLAALAAGKMDRFAGSSRRSRSSAAARRSGDLLMLPATSVGRRRHLGVAAPRPRARRHRQRRVGPRAPRRRVELRRARRRRTTVVLYGLSGCSCGAPRAHLRDVARPRRGAEPAARALPDELANRTRREPFLTRAPRVGAIDPQRAARGSPLRPRGTPAAASRGTPSSPPPRRRSRSTCGCARARRAAAPRASRRRSASAAAW